ncbi:MAG: 50S ribosomal protein L15 [Patescibacteria group bacterium]|jgi:large subunit ribosomal protein L15
MALHLSNLKAYPTKKRKVVGRGDASGHGTTAGKGSKGQRSRSGGRKNLYRRGLKMFLQQLPKSRGFTSFFPRHVPINVGQLEKIFEAGSVINKERLVNAGLIGDRKQSVKILGTGAVKKKLFVTAEAFSKSAKEAIIKAGGQAITSVVAKPEDKQKA